MLSRGSLVPLTLSLTVVGILLGLGGCPPESGDATAGAGRTFNTPPTVVLTVDITRGIAPLTVNFSSAASTDDGIIVRRRWDFGDGGTSSDIAPSHTYLTTGEFTVTLTLTDDNGASASRTTRIWVTRAPVAVITVDRTAAPSAPATFNFDASQSYDPDGEIIRYQWDFGDGTREVIAVTPHVFATAGTYRVRLTVTDNTGVTASADQFVVVGIPRPRIEFTLPPSTVPNIALSPDSPLWVSVRFTVQPGVPRFIRAGLDEDTDACDAQAALYNAGTGNLLLRLEGPAKPVTCVAFSSNGYLVITGSQDGTLRQYNAVDGLLWRIATAANSAPITSVAFSPDGNQYVYGTAEGAVVLMDTAAGTVIRTFAGHAGPAHGVVFSADGTRIASAGEDAKVNVYNAATAEVLRTFDGHTAAVKAAAFAPNDANMVVSGGADKQAKLWRVSDGVVLTTMDAAHDGTINQVAFTPDAQAVLTACEDKKTRLYAIFGIGGNTLQRTFAQHTAGVRAVAASPDGKWVLTGSADGTAILWDIATGQALRTFAPCTSGVTSVAFSPDGKQVLLGVAAQNSIQLDTDPPNGNDLNLTIPRALDLRGLRDRLGPTDYPKRYYLWAEIRTDRTEPVRTYAPTQVQIVKPFTATVSVDTPSVPLVSDQAAVVLAPTTSRQIFNLGVLRAGDRVFLSLLSTPGYGEFYDSDAFSVMMLDANQSLFAWYQSDFILFTRDAKLIIGHDSPNYYVVVDGCRQPQCNRNALGESISIRLERDVGLVTRGQKVFLDYRGNPVLRIRNRPPVDIPPFLASSLNPDWVDTPLINYTRVVKTAIEARLSQLFEGYAVTFYTSDGPLPDPPYQTLYFGGTADTPFGVSNYIDPRNDTLTGAALVATLSVRDEVNRLESAPTPASMGLSIGNAAAREVGHLLGLRKTSGGILDLMNPEAPINAAALTFMEAPLRSAEQYNSPAIGWQNAPQLLLETVGAGSGGSP